MTGWAMAAMRGPSEGEAEANCDTSSSAIDDIGAIALPAILVMEVLGAVIATFVLHRARESSQPDPTTGAAPAGAQRA